MDIVSLLVIRKELSRPGQSRFKQAGIANPRGATVLLDQFLMETNHFG